MSWKSFDFARPSIFIVILGLVIGLKADGAGAALPTRLQSRTQDPAVEPIIQALETKLANAGDGTWKLSSGPLNQPSTACTLGTSGSQWYLQCGDPKSPWLMYSDGQEFYEPAARLRYDTDTLEEGYQNNYGLNYLLLSVNLRPGQFLRNKPLRLVGNATIDGVQYQQLQANIKGDLAPHTTLYARSASARPRVVQIDYYYDPAHTAIARMVVSYGGLKAQMLATTTAWDALGTAAQWPAKIKSQFQTLTTTQPTAVGQVVLASLDGFNAGKDAQVAAAQQSTSAVVFYMGIPDDLHHAFVYAAAAAANPTNLTESVCLAQAYFDEHNVSQGLAQWQALEPRLTAQADQRALLTALLQPAARCLTHAQLGSLKQGPACAQLVAKIAGLNLTDAQWQAISQPIAFAWSTFRSAREFTPQLQPQDATLIDRIAHKGSYPALRILVDLAQKDKTFAAQIDPVLLALAGEPLPPAGYANTQQSTLIALCTDLRLWGRAQAYLAKLQWNASTPDASKTAVTLLSAALNQRAQERQQTVSAQSMAVLADQYRQAKDPSLVADDRTRRAIEKAVARNGALAVRLAQRQKQVVPPADLVTGTAANPVAKDYWDAVIGELVDLSAPAPTARKELLKCVSELGSACQTQFNLSGYESNTWLRIGKGKLFDSRTTSPSIRMDYLNKAFATAVDDTGRLAAMRAITGLLEQTGQFDQASQVIGQLKSSLTSPAAQTQADAMTQSIAQGKLLYQARLQTTSKKVAVNQLKGQLAFLQSQLESSREQGKSEEELDSIQAVIDKTKAAISASTQPAAAQPASAATEPAASSSP